MDIKYIHNANLVLENGILWDGAIIVEDGKIAKFGKETEIAIPEGAVKIDAKGNYVGPGFVDIHVHGGNGALTCFDTEKACDFFLSHGTTSILATNDYLWDLPTQLDAIANVKKHMGKVKNLKGIYFEGPFINPKYGAGAFNNKWDMQTREEEYKPIVDAAGDLAKVWAFAPERDNVIEFLKYAKKVNPSVKLAVAHSHASPQQIFELGIYKPTIQTHTMCATHRITKTSGGTRGFGPDEYAFRDPDLYTELISDSLGIHVNAVMQQLLLHTKTVERVILITDSTIAEGENPPHLAHVTDLNFDARGGICGSRMTMEQACKNIMTSTNCGIAQAFKMASTNPAKAVGLDEVGSIFVGKDADFVFVDDKFNIKRVISQGEICY